MFWSLISIRILADKSFRIVFLFSCLGCLLCVLRVFAVDFWLRPSEQPCALASLRGFQLSARPSNQIFVILFHGFFQEFQELWNCGDNAVPVRYQWNSQGIFQETFSS